MSFFLVGHRSHPGRTGAVGLSAFALAVVVAACASATTRPDDADPGIDGAAPAGNDEPDGGGASRDGSDDGSKPPPPGTTPEGACLDYAKARCAKQKSCASFSFAFLWGDETTLEERLSLGCMKRIEAPGATMTPKDLEACAGAVGSAACEDYVLDVLPPACSFVGTLGDDEACAYDEQCATGHCKKGTASACGTCKAFDGYCSSRSDCPAGKLCGGNFCETPKPLGDTCSTAWPCAPGLVCTKNKCTQAAPVGTTCGQTRNAPDPCDRSNGVVCDVFAMRCVQVNVVATGQACDPTRDVCAGDGDCDGTCLPPLKEGSDCRATGPSCLAPATCDLGTCVVPSADSCK